MLYGENVDALSVMRRMKTDPAFGQERKRRQAYRQTQNTALVARYKALGCK